LVAISHFGRLHLITTVIFAQSIWANLIWKYSITQNTLFLSVLTNLIIEYIQTLELYSNLYSNQQQIRATATGFLNETVKNMIQIMKNQSTVQWNLYSAHDTTVGNILAALNMTNLECIYKAFLDGKTSNTDTCVTMYPHFTANLIF
jgi:hypothetical protein